MMVRAMCSVNEKAFSILFRRLGVEGWVAEKAFKRSEHEADSRYEMRSLKGIYLDETYPGCPHCGDKSFFQCLVCDLLNCLGAAVRTTDGQIAACCARCDNGGIVSGVIKELRGSREQ
jgi:hypothetical protein